MTEWMNLGFRWSLFLIVITTCCVLVYLTLVLTLWLGKRREKVRIVRKWSDVRENLDWEQIKTLWKTEKEKAVQLLDRLMRNRREPVEEVFEYEPVAAKKKKNSFHKWFWIGVGVSYLVSLVLMFWFFLVVLLVLGLAGKFMANKVA